MSKDKTDTCHFMVSIIGKIFSDWFKMSILQSKKSYPNNRLHSFSCILKVSSNMIVNIMKCQKNSIRYLYLLYLVQRGDCHFCNALAPQCTYISATVISFDCRAFLATITQHSIVRCYKLKGLYYNRIILASGYLVHRPSYKT